MIATIQPVQTKRRWVVRSVLVLVFLGLVLGGYSAVMSLRYAVHKSENRSHLKIIGLAFHNYHDKYQCFPPAYVLGEDGRRWHSWRVLILPFIDGQELYSQYRFDEPWNGPHNKLLADKIPLLYSSPFNEISPGCTPYLAIVGSRTAFPGPFCLQIKDYIDGTSNTMMLMEKTDSDINWMEPADYTSTELQKDYLEYKKSSSPEEKRLPATLWADGRVRIVDLFNISGGLFLGLMTPSYRAAKFNNEEMAIHFPEESKRGLGITQKFGATQQAEKLMSTSIVPHLYGKIIQEKNIVYCATLQIAWDDFRKTECNGQPIQLFGSPPLADGLNRSIFPLKSLSAQCYFATGGEVDQIAAAMKERFPHVSPKLSPPSLDRNSFTFYTYLEKEMPFDRDFERLSQSISFQMQKSKQKVNCFGLKPSETNQETGEAIFEEQVKILHYKNADDFVIRLTTDGDQKDEIILAKVPSGKTLAETLQQTRDRINNKSVLHDRFFLETVDTLSVPIMEINVEKTYNELHNKNIINIQRNDLWLIHAAKQTIKLRIDETGGVLISEAEVQIVGEFGESDPSPAKEPRKLIFDKPFLIYIQEPHAKEPYFVAWMANTELMELK